jgi:hypothetical protein
MKDRVGSVVPVAVVAAAECVVDAAHQSCCFAGVDQAADDEAAGVEQGGSYPGC